MPLMKYIGSLRLFLILIYYLGANIPITALSELSLPTRGALVF